jgi:hypothetical protein
MANSSDPDLLGGIDRAALVFAATAAAVTLATDDGDWTAFSTFVGVTLCLLVLAFHRPVHVARGPRPWLMRSSFGFTLSLCLFIALAWPLQSAAVTSVILTTDVGVGTWLTIWALVLTALEAPLARWLQDAPKTA